MPNWEARLSSLQRPFVSGCIERAGVSREVFEGLVDAASSSQRYRKVEVLGVRNYEARFDSDLPRSKLQRKQRTWNGGADTNLGWSSGFYNDKSDENLYTVRFADIVSFCKSRGFDLDIVMPFLANMPESVVINTLVWSLATSGDLKNAELLAGAGWFSEIDDFVALAKETNILAKAYRLRGVDNAHFMELAAFTGYRTKVNDGDDTELVQQVYEMFDNTDPYVAGYEELYRARYNWSRYPPVMPAKRFRDYVLAAEWVSDGSAAFSGAERPELLLDGNEIRLRLTKARMADTMEAGDLIDLIKARAGVVLNEPLKKAETQKIRWIYSTDVVSYLIHDYLCQYIDKGVVIEGLSLGEGLRALLSRLATTLADCSLGARDGLTALLAEPFFVILQSMGVEMTSRAVNTSVQWMGDIDKMDNTVRNWQISLWTQSITRTRPVPVWLRDLAEQMPWTTLILRPDIDNEVARREKRRAVELFLRHGPGALKLLMQSGNWVEAKSGLASGLRITSLVGSDVNLNNLEMAADTVNTIVGRTAVSRLQVRGDDSIALCDTPEVAVLLHIFMAGCTTLSTSKSRASRNAEFLRLQYTPPEVSERWGVRGILARSVVSWTQRKPIASEQVSTFASKVVGLFVNYSTLKRRGCNPVVSDLMHSIAERVLSASALDMEWLHASVENGGAGIAPLNRNKYTKRTLPRGSVYNLGSWAVDRTMEKYSSFQVTREEAQVLAATGLINSLAMSDEPAVKNFLRSQPVPRLLSRLAGPPMDWIDRLPPIDVCYNRGSLSSFGSRRDILDRFKLAAEVAKVRGVRSSDLISETDDFLIRRTRKATGLSRPRAVDWLGGALSAGHTDCHPELSAIVLRIAVGIFLHIGLRGDDHLSNCHYVASLRMESASAVLASW